LDLLGRKVTMQGGRAVQYWVEEVQKTVAEASRHHELKPLVDELNKALGQLDAVTRYLLGLMPTNTEVALSDATLYLELFGIINIAWQWVRQATVATENLPNAQSEDDRNFYQGKLMTARYFVDYELVKVRSLAIRLQSPGSVTVDMQSEWF
jgi:butyryl-CoA dehydrogenase